MTNRINTYLFGASMVALTFSLNITNANAASTCAAMPTCADMGYTQTSCPNNTERLKCPFDTTKMKCISNSSCDVNLYTLTSCDSSKGTCISCEGKYRYSSCKSSYVLDSVSNTCEEPIVYDPTCANPGFGYVMYADGACSSRAVERDEPIVGIVFDVAKRLIMDLNVSLYDRFITNGSPVHIGEIKNYTDSSTAITDVMGKMNTYYYQQDDENSSRDYGPPDYCYHISYGNVTQPFYDGWYLPALGELIGMQQPNKDRLNDIMSSMDYKLHIGSDLFGDYNGSSEVYVSSTTGDDTEVWVLYPDDDYGDNLQIGNKDDFGVDFVVRCVHKF